MTTNAFESKSTNPDNSGASAERLAAAELLYFALQGGDQEDIAIANELIKELSETELLILGLTPTQQVVRLPRVNGPSPKPQHSGGRRRMLLTSGTIDPGFGTPKAWQSPEEQF